MAPLSGFGLTSFLIATSFAAGLNAYATVAALGLLARAGVVALPSSLDLLRDWTVIAAAVSLFAIEFVADKIPVFDLLWNALHTFVRVPVAALLAFNATSQLPFDARLGSTILGASIALIAHTGKTAARAAVTPSPEPFSNVALSLAEDVLAVGLTWLATRHPYLAAGFALLSIAVIVLSIRAVVRLVGRWLAQLRERTLPVPRS